MNSRNKAPNISQRACRLTPTSYLIQMSITLYRKWWYFDTIYINYSARCWAGPIMHNYANVIYVIPSKTCDIFRFRWKKFIHYKYCIFSPHVQNSLAMDRYFWRFLSNLLRNVKHTVPPIFVLQKSAQIPNRLYSVNG